MRVSVRADHTQHPALASADQEAEALCRLGELPLQDMSASIAAIRCIAPELADQLTAIKIAWASGVCRHASKLQRDARVALQRSNLQRLLLRVAAEGLSDCAQLSKPLAKRLERAVAAERGGELPDAS